MDTNENNEKQNNMSVEEFVKAVEESSKKIIKIYEGLIKESRKYQEQTKKDNPYSIKIDNHMCYN